MKTREGAMSKSVGYGKKQNCWRSENLKRHWRATMTEPDLAKTWKSAKGKRVLTKKEQGRDFMTKVSAFKSLHLWSKVRSNMSEALDKVKECDI